MIYCTNGGINQNNEQIRPYDAISEGAIQMHCTMAHGRGMGNVCVCVCVWSGVGRWVGAGRRQY